MSKIAESFLQDLDFGKGDLFPSQSGDLDTINGINNLKQRLYHRLITVKGTLSHRPFYGVGVQRFQNALDSIGKQRELALEIKEQFLQDNGVESVESVIIKREFDKTIIQYKILAKGFGQAGDSISFGDFSL